MAQPMQRYHKPFNTLRCGHLCLQPSATFHVHEITFDELYSKPQWFLDLNPTGLIPVISWQNTNSSNSSRLPVVNAAAAGGEGGDNVISITESLICNEFLEDAYPQPPVSEIDCDHRHDVLHDITAALVAASDAALHTLQQARFK